MRNVPFLWHGVHLALTIVTGGYWAVVWLIWAYRYEQRVRNSPPPLCATAHWLHALLTVCTFGLWGIVWLARGATNRQNNLRDAHNREQRKP